MTSSNRNYLKNEFIETVFVEIDKGGSLQSQMSSWRICTFYNLFSSEQMPNNLLVQLHFRKQFKNTNMEYYLRLFNIITYPIRNFIPKYT